MLAWLAAAVIRYPRWFIYPQAALFLVCVLYTVVFLKTDMNRDNLVGPNQKYHQNFLKLQKEFPQQGNGLVVVVESDNLGEKPAICRTHRREDAGGNQFLPRRFLPAELVGHGGEGLLFADEEDLAELKQKLTMPCRSSASSRRPRI